ncbi:MAG: hypothetical protein ABEJ70_06115 [Halobacteriaceae archaeon]
MDARAALTVEDLLKVVLALVAVWLVLEILDTVLGMALAVLGWLRPLLGLLVVALIVLWLVDRL